MAFDIQQWIEDNKEQFIKISDDVWQYAEVGLFESKSSALHSKILEEAGFEVTHGIAGLPTAVKATYGKGKPVIAVLGEFDALPGLSQKAKPTKEPRVAGAPGHGCGHNLYGAACLAASIAIKNMIEMGELSGTIHYYGCPAEENSHGKTWMVKAGLFDEVDISLTWHPWDINFVWSSNFQAMYNVVFQFKGQTAHAAADPFNGRSALDGVELMNVGCNYLREHMTTNARIHYVITKGGEAPNIVPDEAEVWYYVRAPRLDQVKDLYSRVVRVAKGAAMMTETEVKIFLLGGSANMLPNITLENLIHEKMKEVGPPQFTKEDRIFAQEIKKSFPANHFDNFLAKIVSTEVQTNLEKYRNKDFFEEILPIFGRGVTLGGSTDVGDVTWVTPVAQFSTVCSAIGTPDHSWQLTAQAGMNIGHQGMLQGAKVLALATAELMQDLELVKKARDEFEEQIKITPYECPISDDASPPIEYFRRVYAIQK